MWSLGIGERKGQGEQVWCSDSWIIFDFLKDSDFVIGLRPVKTLGEFTRKAYSMLRVCLGLNNKVHVQDNQALRHGVILEMGPREVRHDPFQNIHPERSARNTMTETVHLWQLQWLLEKSPFRAGQSLAWCSMPGLHPDWQLWCSHTQPLPGCKLAPGELIGSSVHDLFDPKPQTLTRTIEAPLLIAIPLGKNTVNDYKVIFYPYLWRDLVNNFFC